MIYGDRIIRDLLENGLVKAPGVDPSQVNPASLNLRLGNTFLIMRETNMGIRLGDEVPYSRFEVPDGGCFPMEPGDFILATTKEVLQLPDNVAGFIQGRSSIGRIGRTTQNAGFVDPGFHGAITLELVNESGHNLYLKPGYPVAQIVFMEAKNVSHPYEGKYNGQVEATGSRMFKDIIPVSHILV